MLEPFSLDAYSPKEIAARVEGVGVAKARLPLVTTAVLGLLAGAFIGLGALYYTLVMSDGSLGFAAARLAGAVCFTLGLLLVVVAGAELFTGNNLIVMAWADGRISSREVLRNWGVVCLANFAGAAGLAVLVVLSGHPDLNGGAVAKTYLGIAQAKAALPFWTAFFRGVLCNVLVCMAVWMSFAGRSVTDKFFAIVLPISAFVAAGFEHSIANMYFFPMAFLLQWTGTPLPAGTLPVGVGDMLGNLFPVILGNIAGGSVLVALVYWQVYLRPARKGGD
ncbi:MAG TPA: formate/nitrite transporter family protein [Burkholderiales bacterium]